MFNIKECKLSPGALIVFEHDHLEAKILCYNKPLYFKGKCAMVVKHAYPSNIIVLFEEKKIILDYRGNVPIHGFVTDFSLVQKQQGDFAHWHKREKI